MSIPPPPSRMLRLLAVVVNEVPVIWRFPPSNVIPPARLPRLPSSETERVPPFSVHGVSSLVVLVRVQRLVPRFSNRSNPWYWFGNPNCVTSNEESTVPPRAKVSIPPVAMTLPWILEPAQISRSLPPPVNSIAFAWTVPFQFRPPAMMPSLITLVFPQLF